MPLVSVSASPQQILPRLGVVILTYNASDVIAECLDSLFANQGVKLNVVVVDNDSPSPTLPVVRAWASGEAPFVRPPGSPLHATALASVPIAFEERGPEDKSAPRCPLTLIQTGLNGGFAYGVNRGLEVLLADPGIDAFWILNPDCAVPQDTARLLAEEVARGPFAMIGARQVFYAQPDVIQSDGFRLDRWTCISRSINLNISVDAAIMPENETLDFCSGASMVVSREFIARAGLMWEKYFLYFEEPDWGVRRGNLPVRMAPGALIYHHTGTAIGTGTNDRLPSPFSVYFNYRNRTHFSRRNLARSLPIVLLHGLAKAAQYLLVHRAPGQAWACLAGTFDLPPPTGVRKRFADPRVSALAFGEDS